MAGPEIAKILSDFEDQFQRQRETDVRHQEQLQSIQKAFASDLNFEKLGNPLSEDSIMTCMCLKPKSSCLMKW